MQIPTEILAGIIGGIIGSLIPAFLTYVETVRAGYQQRLMLADEIEENDHILFAYGQLQEDWGRRILCYEPFNLYAWQSAKESRFLFLSQYELTYVSLFYKDVQQVAYYLEHLKIYRLDDEKTREEALHVIRLISDDCTIRHVAPENNISYKLVHSLKRKINLLNYYPILWNWIKSEIR